MYRASNSTRNDDFSMIFVVFSHFRFSICFPVFHVFSTARISPTNLELEQFIIRSEVLSAMLFH